MSAAQVAVRDYSLAFDGFDGAHHVLDRVDLELAGGETVGLVGETGCGKSVLARSLLRLNPAPPARVTSGTITFEQRDMLAMSPLELQRVRGSQVAMVFQDPSTFLNPVFTIGSQMATILRARDRADGRRRTSAAIAADAERLLNDVRLPDPAALLRRYPHELSGGMRQRVLIAMALAGQPRLLIADEPTTALDVLTQAEIMVLVAGLVRERGLTLLLISHDLAVVGAMCRRIVVMYAGAVVEDAPASQLLSAPQHPYTRALISALPDPEGGPMPKGLGGAIPDLRRPPSGCRFHPRCPAAISVCSLERPALRAGPVGRGLAACHRLGSL